MDFVIARPALLPSASAPLAPAPPARARARPAAGLHLPASRVTASDGVSARTLAAARRGDHKAFVGILRHYDRRLRLIAYRLLADRQLMDDALQDVALKAFRALPEFRGDASVGTWLYRITYTTCLDYLRRTRPVDLMPSDELPEPPGPRPDIAESVCERDQLQRRLALLTPEQRLAVLLVDQEGFDYHMAGQILGIPSGTVGSRLNTAHAILRRGLRTESADLAAAPANDGPDSDEFRT